MVDKQVLCSCLCGALQISARLPSLWVAHCHCTQCQRAHGAALVTWAGFAEAQVRIDDPRQQLHWYASSPEAQRGFCASCGTSLLFRSSQWPGEVHIARACIQGDIDREPQAHVYFDTHVSWLQLDDHLPRKDDPVLASPKPGV